MGIYNHLYTKLEVQPTYEIIEKRFLNKVKMLYNNIRSELLYRNLNHTIIHDELLYFNDMIPSNDYNYFRKYDLKDLLWEMRTLIALNKVILGKQSAEKIILNYYKINSELELPLSIYNTDFNEENRIIIHDGLYYKYVYTFAYFRAVSRTDHVLTNYVETMEYIKSSGIEDKEYYDKDYINYIYKEVMECWDTYPEGIIVFY